MWTSTSETAFKAPARLAARLSLVYLTASLYFFTDLNLLIKAHHFRAVYSWLNSYTKKTGTLTWTAFTGVRTTPAQMQLISTRLALTGGVMKRLQAVFSCLGTCAADGFDVMLILRPHPCKEISVSPFTWATAPSCLSSCPAGSFLLKDYWKQARPLLKYQTMIRVHLWFCGLNMGRS